MEKERKIKARTRGPVGSICSCRPATTDMGDRFWVYAVYDQRTDQVGHLGQQYGTEAGFYLLVGPDWAGEVPEGIKAVVRSPTNLALIVPRFFLDDTDEDREAIQPLISKVMVYPLSDYDGEWKSINWAETPSFGEAAKGGETKWVRPETFLAQLRDVLDMVPPLPGEEAVYSQFRAVVAAADRDPEIARVFNEAVAEVDKVLIPDFLRWEFNGRPAGNNWNRSQNNAEWGLDYNNHHFFYPNELNRYSLGTKNKSLQYGDDGSLTIYVGNTTPGADKESNWIPAPAEKFALYIRAYWGKEGILDGSWQPPVVQARN